VTRTSAPANVPPRGEESEARRFPGDPDMWVFVAVESLVFTSYFCVYLYAREIGRASCRERV